jgi:hypothetical protein
MLATNLLQECIIVEALQVAEGTYLASAHRADTCNQPDTANVFREKVQRARILRVLIEQGQLNVKGKS